jgi:hypothetical protein
LPRLSCHRTLVLYALVQRSWMLAGFDRRPACHSLVICTSGRNRPIARRASSADRLTGAADSPPLADRWCPDRACRRTPRRRRRPPSLALAPQSQTYLNLSRGGIIAHQASRGWPKVKSPAEQLPVLAEEVVRLGPSVILAPASSPAVAAKKATATIPIGSFAAIARPSNIHACSAAEFRRAFRRCVGARSQSSRIARRRTGTSIHRG